MIRLDLCRAASVRNGSAKLKDVLLLALSVVFAAVMGDHTATSSLAAKFGHSEDANMDSNMSKDSYDHEYLKELKEHFSDNAHFGRFRLGQNTASQTITHPQ